MAITRTLGVLICTIVAVVQAAQVQAETIQIQLGGVGFSYNGASITDAGTADPDSLTHVTFLFDDVQFGMDDTGVTLDLNIPDVFDIPVLGGQVNSAANGSLYLDLGDGEFLSLTLDSAIVTYAPVTSTVQFIFTGAASNIAGQHLPYGLSLVDPVSVSFSTQIMEPITQSGGYVTGFLSAGTGELQAIPEPATMSLLALAGLALIRRQRA